MKVLLAALNAKYIHSNLAVYSLRAYGEKFLGISKEGGDSEEDTFIEIAEYTINQPVMKILKDIYERKADLVLFSCYIWNIRMIKQLVEDFSKVAPDIDIWLGGPEVSYNSADILKKYSGIKGIIKGEGEETFCDILRAYGDRNEDRDKNREKAEDRDRTLAMIRGIDFRTDRGEIQENGQREYMDIDELPFLYSRPGSHKDMLEDFENRIIYYETSRGCPYRCSYCLSAVNQKPRFRKLDKVKEELGYFLKSGVSQVKLIDRTFNCRHDRTMEIWKFLKENDNGVTNFHFEITGDILSKEEIELLNTMRAGQLQLEIGVQSVNPYTLKAINRAVDFDKLSEAVRRIRVKDNVHIHLDLIAGLPFEDYDSFKRSFNSVFFLKPHQLQLGFLKVLKGSPIEKECERYGLKFTAMPPYEVLESKWLSYSQIVSLKGVEEMVEIYYNSGQFENSLAVLLEHFPSPFDFFEDLSEWYASEGLELMNISRNGRYESLLKFSGQMGLAAEESLRKAMVKDYYLRENAKNRPEFFGESEVERSFEKSFYREEAEFHRYLKGGRFSTDQPRVLRKLTHMEKIDGVYYLFDYENRNPMNNNARMIEIGR